MAQTIRWQKSSFSGGGDGDTCIELAATPTRVHLRESDAPATELRPARTALAYLLDSIKARRR
ncbi:DUF397 domain-containing protein [Streptomyces sp. DSM 118878]